MKNKDYYVLVKKIVNVVSNDKNTENAINEIFDFFKRYDNSLELIYNLNDSIDYKKVLLSAYYGLSRMSEIPYEIHSDYNGNTAIELTVAYIESVLRKAGLYKEYGVQALTQTEYDYLKEKYNLL